MNDDWWWQRVEVAGVVLHIPSGWDAFRYHGLWFVKDEATGQFVWQKGKALGDVQPERTPDSRRDGIEGITAFSRT